MPESPFLFFLFLPLARRVSSNSLLLRFIEIGRGGWLPSVKSRRKWGSVDAARRQRRRIHDERYSRDIRETEAERLRHPRKHARRCTALFRLVSGRGPKVSPACVCMRDARVPSLRVEKWRLGYSRIRDDRTPGNGLIRCLVPVVLAQYYKRAKWTSIRGAFLFEWKSEQLLCMYSFPVFNLRRYLATI